MDPISKEQPESVKRHDAPATPEPEAVTALRQAYRRYWTTLHEAPEAFWGGALFEVKMRKRAVPEEEARRILREEAETFHAERGYCPFCGKAGPLHSFEQVTGKGNERWHPGRLLTGEEREDYEEWAGIIEFEWDYPRDEAERMAYEYVMRERKGSRRRRSEKWTTYE